MELCGFTDKGEVRRQNQDAYITFNENGVAALIVCDGMGGAKAGDIASTLAAKTFIEKLREGLKRGIGGAELKRLMKESADSANSEVFEKSCEDEDCEGMGTTLVAAAVIDGIATVLNIGDSRAYHISESDIRRITRDHSVVEDMVARGEITPDEARFHPRKNLITRALGTAPEVRGDIFTVKLQKGDILLLCSDGMSNMVYDEEMLPLSAEEKLEDFSKRLFDITVERGAPDNVTIVLYRE